MTSTLLKHEHAKSRCSPLAHEALCSALCSTLLLKHTHVKVKMAPNAPCGVSPLVAAGKHILEYSQPVLVPTSIWRPPLRSKFHAQVKPKPLLYVSFFLLFPMAVEQSNLASNLDINRKVRPDLRVWPFNSSCEKPLELSIHAQGAPKSSHTSQG